MIKDGIFCVPKFDEATSFSFKWNERLREKIGNRLNFILLLMDDAVRNNVEKSLNEKPSVLFCFYDHGSENSLIGQDSLPVVDLGNVDLFKGREVYTMACLSAYTLGKMAYKNGCLAFWGYVRVVSFTTDVEESFCEAFNFGLLYYLENHSWSECLEATKQRMTEIIDDLVKQGNGLAAMLLREDRDALVCYNGGTPPQEICPVSNLIAKLFGYRTLTKLRKIRSYLRGEGNG